MKVQTISGDSVAVFLDIKELNEQGLEPDSINASNTMRLARQAFVNMGLSVDGGLEVEAYINAQGVMFFARIREMSEEVHALFMFDCFEELLECVGAMARADLPRSTLIYAHEAYYLALHDPLKKPVMHALEEFGLPEVEPALYYLHLCEHGKTLCRQNAAAVLEYSFHGGNSVVGA